MYFHYRIAKDIAIKIITDTVTSTPYHEPLSNIKPFFTRLEPWIRQTFYTPLSTKAVDTYNSAKDMIAMLANVKTYIKSLTTTVKIL